MKSIEITPKSRGASIAFPFEYKDIFRDHFPSARWDAGNNVWTVGTTSVPLLKQFAEEAQKHLDMRLEREERELAAEEIVRLEKRFAKIDDDINSMKAQIEDLDIARGEIEEMRVGIAAKEDELSAIAAQRDAAAARRDAARRDVHELVSAVVDIEEIEEARTEMRKHMKIAKAWASTKYDAAETRLWKIREQLTAAGIECEAVNSALRANRNRPDRDFANLSGPLDFQVT